MNENESLFRHLQKYSASGALPMHMPGHKRRVSGIPFLEELGAHCDITEIDGFDDLHAPEGALLDGMRRAARLWGADESRFLVNGTTCGLLAAVYALAADGGRAIVARNCHKSVYHALELTGVEPVFVMPDVDAETGVCGRIPPEDVRRALEEAPDARFVLVTSPTYEGVISDIAAICRAAHERNVPVIVDEAHGAHLGLCDEAFPADAMRMGADISYANEHLEGAEPVGDVHVAFGPQLVGTVVTPEEIPTLVDEVPVLAIAAAAAQGETVFQGAGELRVKESDRFAAVIEGLAAFGVRAWGEGDELHIQGTGEPLYLLGDALADEDSLQLPTYHDHRLAMTWYLMGLATEAPVVLDDASCVSVSWPSFYADIEGLM